LRGLLIAAMNHDKPMVSTRLDENQPIETKALETLRKTEGRLARLSLKVLREELYGKPGAREAPGLNGKEKWRTFSRVD
jgi:hypothetical protein